MGAFYLYRSDVLVNEDAVKEVFEKKYMGIPQTIKDSGWTLVLYKKKQRENFNIVQNGSDYLAVVGAAMYKDYPQNKVADALFEDIRSEKLDTSSLSGHFNLIYSVSGKRYILLDSMRSKHVFYTEDGLFISSSMMACAAAYPQKLSINKNAVYEKMMLGIIIAPDTPFCEIKAVSSSIDNDISGIDIKAVKCANQIESKSESFEKVVNKQIRVLDGYFQQLKAYSSGEMVDTGLSAGYDSRLAFSMMLRHFKDNIHVHTHSTKNVHDREKTIAFKMAEIAGVSCNAIPTSKLSQMDDVTPLIRDSLYFFDGRSSFVIGGVNQTYTADYRVKATENSPVTLTGVGGETYRNYYHVFHRKKRLDYYINRYIICPEFYEAIQDTQQIATTTQHVFEKIEKYFGCQLKEMKGLLFFRRYYSEIMMADGQGVLLDAYNQVSDCFAPFIERSVVKTSYDDINHIGIDGRFEAAMIRAISPELAALNSSYGHNFMKIPNKVLIKQYFKSLVSSRTWNRLAVFLPKYRNKHPQDDMRVTLNKTDFFVRAENYFKEQFPNIDLEKLYQGKYEFKNMSTLISLLYIYSYKTVTATSLE